MLVVPLVNKVLYYLSCEDILNASKVNRTFNAASKDSALWLREALRLILPSNEFPIISNTNKQTSTDISWKLVCVHWQVLKRQWENSLTLLLTPGDGAALYRVVLEILKFPPLSFPPLRREIHCFPTVVQDLLGNPLDQLVQHQDPITHSETFKNAIETHRDFLTSEFNYYNETDVFMQALKGAKHCSNSFLLKLYENLQETLEFYCRVVVKDLKRNTEPDVLLSEYLHYWNCFSQSLPALNSFFLPFTQLLNSIRNSEGSSLSILKLMVKVWKRIVWKQLSGSCLESFNFLLERERLSLLQSGKLSYEITGVLGAFTQALCDISLDESSVYFKTHSQLNNVGPLLELHAGILLKTGNFYKNLSLKVHKAAEFYEKEQMLLEMVCLPVTYVPIKKYKYQILAGPILDEVKEAFVRHTDNSKGGDYDRILTSPIAGELLNSPESRGKVRDFLLGMASSDLQYLVDVFNSIKSQDLEQKSYEDSQVERIAKMMGYSLNPYHNLVNSTF